MWSAWLCPSFVSALRGEGALAEAGRLAALALSQATHCATLPRKSPGLRGTGGWGGSVDRPKRPGPPKALQQAPGGPLCPQLNHLTHLVPSAWWGLVHLGTVLRLSVVWPELELIIQTQQIYNAYTIGSTAQYHKWELWIMGDYWLLDTRKGNIIVNKMCALMYCFVTIYVMQYHSASCHYCSTSPQCTHCTDCFYN